MSDIVRTRYGVWDRENDPCPGCGDGDKVPAGEYFRCEVCDAEWEEEDEAPPQALRDHPLKGSGES